MIGSIISGVGSAIGGILGHNSAKDAQAQNLAMAQANMEMQKDFAQRGIRWKVEDAKKAGIHPIYALGAPTTSFSPVNFSAQADTSLANMAQNMGQSVGRAVDATRTTPERANAYTQAAQALSLEKGALENQLLASQIKRLQVQTNPPMPIVADSATPFSVPEASKSEDRQPLMIGGHRWMTNPNTSPAKAFEDQYGDSELLQTAIGLLLGVNDLGHNIRTRFPIGSMPWDAPYERVKKFMRSGSITRGLVNPRTY